MRASHRITPVFDDPNLVRSAGLVPVLRLAESAGLYDLLRDHLSVNSPNPVAKAGCVVAGMLTGADSIDDLDVLRHGAMGRLFGGIRAPSTLGTYLRSFTHVRMTSPFGPTVLLCFGPTLLVDFSAGGWCWAQVMVVSFLARVVALSR